MVAAPGSVVLTPLAAGHRAPNVGATGNQPGQRHQEPAVFSNALARQIVTTVTENDRRRSRAARLRAHRT